MNTQAPARGGRRGRQARERGETVRNVDYRRLRNPFPQMKLYSDDAIAAMHDAALTTLEDLGVKILLAEARQMFRSGGARRRRQRDGLDRTRDGGSGAGNRATLDPVPRRRPRQGCASSRGASCSSLAPARPMPPTWNADVARERPAIFTSW